MEEAQVTLFLVISVDPCILMMNNKPSIWY